MIYPLPSLKRTLKTCGADVWLAYNLEVQIFRTSLGLLLDGTRIEIVGNLDEKCGRGKDLSEDWKNT